MPRLQTSSAILFLVTASLIGCENAKAPPPAPFRPPATELASPAIPAASNRAQDTVAEAAIEPEIKVSAKQIANDYSTDADAADGKYRQKSVRIEGKITKREINKDGLHILILEGDGALDIHCGISFESWRLYDSLKVDQTVSVVGEVFGIINNAVSVGQGQIER